MVVHGLGLNLIYEQYYIIGQEPTKVGLVDKESTHNLQFCEFESRCRYKGLVGR